MHEGKYLKIDLDEVLNGLENFGVYITDTSRKIIYWNETAEKITGFSKTDVLGMACSDGILCHVDRHDRDLCGKNFCPLFQCMRRKKSKTLNVFVFGKHKNGRRIPLAVSVSPVKNKKGEVIAGMEVFRDASIEIGQMQMAHSIQKKMLPDSEIIGENWPIAFEWLPAEMIGGDFIQILERSGNKIIGFIADVTGHGISSALITSYIWNFFQNLNFKTSSPSEILGFLAKEYWQLEIHSHIFSAQAFVFDMRKSELIFSNAGHPPPLILNRPGDAGYFETSGDLIGFASEPSFSDKRIDLKKKRMVFYTDGITDSSLPNGAKLGEAGFKKLALEMAPLPRREMCRQMIRRTFDQTMSTEPEDDMTVLVIDGNGY